MPRRSVSTYSHRSDEAHPDSNLNESPTRQAMRSSMRRSISGPERASPAARRNMERLVTGDSDRRPSLTVDDANKTRRESLRIGSRPRRFSEKNQSYRRQRSTSFNDESACSSISSAEDSLRTVAKEDAWVMFRDALQQL